jgi:hypothetical protein
MQANHKTPQRRHGRIHGSLLQRRTPLTRLSPATGLAMLRAKAPFRCLASSSAVRCSRSQTLVVRPVTSYIVDPPRAPWLPKAAAGKPRASRSRARTRKTGPERVSKRLARAGLCSRREVRSPIAWAARMAWGLAAACMEPEHGHGLPPPLPQAERWISEGRVAVDGAVLTTGDPLTVTPAAAGCAAGSCSRTMDH